MTPERLWSQLHLQTVDKFLISRFCSSGTFQTQAAQQQTTAATAMFDC